jgi:hypothetical protein
VIFVQHVYNPGAPVAGEAPVGAPVNYFTQTVAVTYDTTAHKWAIRNEDLSVMPANVVYDVFVTRFKVFLPLVRR